MNDYRFNLSDMTIGDMMRVRLAAQSDDVYGILLIANQFIPINLFALPVNEIKTVLVCFLHAIVQSQPAPPPDPIDQLIMKALEDTR